MDNNKIDNLRPQYPRTTAPYRVFFTWEIHYACNYKCSYCHAPKPWQPQTRKAVYLGTEDWLKIWEKVYQDYGSCRILIGGGEPSTYPSFGELLIGITKMHYIEICTNLSLDVRPIAEHINPRYIKVSSSLHPEFADIDEFTTKLKILKKAGFDTMVNFVPWPPLLNKMKEYKERIESVGVQFVLQPYIGDYQGRQYPGGYTQEEREYFNIFEDDCNRHTLEFKVESNDVEDKSNQTKGKICRMGQNYGFIRADGSVSRCCRDHKLSLGNIIDGTFKLLEEALPCQVDECNCWRFMEVGRDSEWERHWQSPDNERVYLERR